MKTNDYNTRVEVNIDMTKYVVNSISVYPLNIDKYEVVTTLASNNLFKVDGSNPLKMKKRDFHTTLARGLLLCKISSPDIQPNIKILCTRVLKSNQVDWKKLLRLIKYLVGTHKFFLEFS